MANHVLWWYCLYRKDCTWLSVSPLSNTKLSYKAETFFWLLLWHQLDSPPPTQLHCPSYFKEHFLNSGFHRGLDTAYGTFQLQIASTDLAQVSNNVNVWQVFHLCEMTYSNSSSCTGVQCQNEAQQVSVQSSIFPYRKDMYFDFIMAWINYCRQKAYA